MNYCEFLAYSSRWIHAGSKQQSTRLHMDQLEKIRKKFAIFIELSTLFCCHNKFFEEIVALICMVVRFFSCTTFTRNVKIGH